MKVFVVLLVFVVFIGTNMAFAQYYGQIDPQYFLISYEGQHEIRLQSSTTKFNDVFYDELANTIIISADSGNTFTDIISIHMNYSSFRTLLADSIDVEPSDVLVLLDGEEQEYETPHIINGNVVWEFKNKPNVTEIEFILEPERYRDSTKQENKIPKQFAEDDRKRYCDYAVKRNLPTPWKYDCYDEPLANPQREMNLGNPMLNNDLLDCSNDDNPSMCFKDAFDSCTPAMIEQEILTVEGDPVYTGAYITDNCKIHVNFDTREDRYRSLEDRKITQSSCSEIQFKGNKMIFSNCNDLNSFEFSANENDLQTSYDQQWITKIILIGVIVGGISTGIFIAIKLWKKRK